MGHLQKVNHFPGMHELARKAGTARNLNKMLYAVGKDYDFFPKTYALPDDYAELKKDLDISRGLCCGYSSDNNNSINSSRTFIVKPSKGAQGNGIWLTNCPDQISPCGKNIVQRYLHHPHLLEGYKYDLRLYVLLTSVQPLRIFLFRE